jgi:YVTN family beta-propeller protein
MRVLRELRGPGRVPGVWRRAAAGGVLAAGVAVLVAVPGAAAAAAAWAPKVTATIPVGSLPYGVAADPVTNTVYVTNYSDNTVSVICGRTNKVTATVPVGPGPYEVAANPVTNTVYVTNSGNDTVSVISRQHGR